MKKNFQISIRFDQRRVYELFYRYITALKRYKIQLSNKTKPIFNYYCPHKFPNSTSYAQQPPFETHVEGYYRPSVLFQMIQ